MRRDIFALVFAASMLGQHVGSQTLVFDDSRAYGNVQIFTVNDLGQQVNVQSNGSFFEANLTGLTPGQEIYFGIRFLVPQVEGSELDYVGIEPDELQSTVISFIVRVPEVDEGVITVPLSYATEANRRALRKLRSAPNSEMANAFDQFFKSALLAEYFRSQLNGQSTRQYRDAIELWMSAAESIAVENSAWFRMPTQIVQHAEVAFQPGSAKFMDIVSRVNAINELP